MLDESMPIILWEPMPKRVQLQQCNCACSVVDDNYSELGRCLPADSYWQLPANTYEIALPQDHTLIFNPLGIVGPVVVNEPTKVIWRNYSAPAQLTTSTAQQLALFGLLEPTSEKRRLPDNHAHSLTAWLHVTNECNLRCTYCYINKTEEAMSEETGKAAVDTIFRAAQQHNFKVVKLKYAGGEATLNFSLVKTLHTYAQTLSMRTGIALQEVILSNGVGLTNSILDFIRDADIQLSISLDGSAQEHDIQRVFVNGRGSYKQVSRRIDRALEHGVYPHLSITVTGHSVEGLVDAVKFALERDLLFNLNFYRDHDSQKAGEELRAEDDRLITAMRSAFAAIEESLPRRSLIAALVDRANFAGPHQRSCGAGHDYLVIDQAGRVARCQMEIERPVTNIFAHDPLREIQLYATGFQNLAVDEKEGCRNCHWRYWCAGGCSLLTHRITGRNDVKSPYCNVYKAIYPELLRLEGLRLLKWALPLQPPMSNLHSN